MGRAPLPLFPTCKTSLLAGRPWPATAADNQRRPCCFSKRSAGIVNSWQVVKNTTSPATGASPTRQRTHQCHQGLHRRLERSVRTLRVDQDRRRNPRQSQAPSKDVKHATLGEFGGLPFLVLVLVGGCVMVEVSDESPVVMALRKCPVGVSGLDEVTGGGLPHGRVSLVCWVAGAGKSLLALEFLVKGITEHGEAGFLMSFEETAAELAENTRSLGWDLPGMVERGQLAIDHIRVDRSQLTVAGEYDLEALFVRLGHGIEAVR